MIIESVVKLETVVLERIKHFHEMSRFSITSMFDSLNGFAACGESFTELHAFVGKNLVHFVVVFAAADVDFFLVGRLLLVDNYVVHFESVELYLIGEVLREVCDTKRMSVCFDES